MNCFFETLASVWLMSRRAVGISSPACEDDDSVHESLLGCRMSLEVREADLVESCKRLARDAVRRRHNGDLAGARLKLLERRRLVGRLDKLRNSLLLVDAQMDALQSTQLDRELIQTLMASSTALKKAGVGTGVKEAEAVMSELDEQMRETGELTSVLSGSVGDDWDIDVEEELNALMKDGVLDEVEPHAKSQSKDVKALRPLVVNHQIPSAVPSAPEVCVRDGVSENLEIQRFSSGQIAMMLQRF